MAKEVMPYTGPKNPKQGHWMQRESQREEKAGTKGKLRRRLHAKPGQNIPVNKLEKASHAKGSLGQEARMALRYREAKH
jgi:hypothetical protein